MYWYLLLLFLCAFLGGMAVFLFKGGNHKQLKLVLSFSGAYLFGITVLHLIPDAYHGNDHLVGVFILVGFIFQIVLEQFSEGIEHGHMHIHNHDKPIFPLGIMVSLCLHGFLEGMPLAVLGFTIFPQRLHWVLYYWPTIKPRHALSFL
jgi:zinc and cadmium transporter